MLGNNNKSDTTHFMFVVILKKWISSVIHSWLHLQTLCVYTLDLQIQTTDKYIKARMFEYINIYYYPAIKMNTKAWNRALNMRWTSLLSFFSFLLNISWTIIFMILATLNLCYCFHNSCLSRLTKNRLHVVKLQCFNYN